MPSPAAIVLKTCSLHGMSCVLALLCRVIFNLVASTFKMQPHGVVSTHTGNNISDRLVVTN